MFSKYDAKQLMFAITKLDTNKVIDGAEIYIDMSNQQEKEYCIDLVKIMKEFNWILQIHSTDMNTLEEHIIDKYIQYYNKLAFIYGNKIKLTFHPAQESNRYESIQKTIETFKYITKYINQNNLNLEVILENLNEHKGTLRCNIQQVYEIIGSTSIEGITLDIGHYVYDYSNDYTNLNNEYTSKIKNIHIHDIDNDRNDHYPFYYNNVKIQELVKYIKDINYKENIVLEFGLEYLNGETFEDKITEYIKQIEYVINTK